MRALQRILRSTVCAVAAFVGAACGVQAVPLPQLAIDPAEISVSGLSSGGFMAVQLHVAFSSTFRRGAGVVAGGPFYCAEGSIVDATGRCMTHSSAIPVASLVSTTKSWAASGALDPVSNLAGSKVYLYSGTGDNTVRQAVMNDLQTYYRSFVAADRMAYRNDVPSGHAMITDDFGNVCGSTATPFINDCNFDLAGAMLAHLHGALNPRNNAALLGSFVQFEQTAFITGHGMATTGWAFVPRECAGAATRCKLHVVLHGCKQNSATVGEQYVRNTGYNRWADSNRIVVLYPQTSNAATNGCWDWWGYDSPNYAKKSGPQMAAIKAMVDRVSSATAPSTLPSPTGVATSGATASSMVIAWGAVNGTAGYNVQRNGTRVNPSIVSATQYTDSGLAGGTTYSWTVTAVDANGGESRPSAPASGTTTGTPPDPAPVCATASNYAHVSAGRAHQSFGSTYANGSNQAMGLWNVFVVTTLKQTGPNHYVVGSCP